MVTWGENQKKILKKFSSSSGLVKEFEVELFTWEKLDYVEELKKHFEL